MEEIKDKLCRELEQMAGREISPSNLEVIHKLTDSIKNIKKIEMLDGDDGYSSRGYWDARGTYGSDGSYDRDGSYRSRRGTHYVRGHYSRDGGYSRDDAKNEMMEHLEEMMGMADSEKERDAIRRCMDVMKN